MIDQIANSNILIIMYCVFFIGEKGKYFQVMSDKIKITIINMARNLDDPKTGSTEKTIQSKPD